MIDFKEIHKKPYHFTLERIDPENENVPEAIIPDDMNLQFTAEEMLMLRRFYKERGRDVEFEEFEGFDEDSYAPILVYVHFKGDAGLRSRPPHGRPGHLYLSVVSEAPLQP